MSARAAVAGVATGLLLLVGGVLFLPARPGDLECRPLTLIDNVSGTVIQGAEDLAYDPIGKRLVLSAYDRRTEEPGGLYAIPLGRLEDASRTLIEAIRLLPTTGGPHLRPHGLALGAADKDRAPLALIERERRVAGGYNASVRLYSLSERGLAPAGVPLVSPALCSANDLAFTAEGRLLITTDRGACGGWSRVVEDVTGLAAGRVLLDQAGTLLPVARDIAFANGIAISGEDVYVAATRDSSILQFRRPDGAVDAPLVLGARYDISGAPDNLTWGDDGALYVAAHASLLRYAAFRAGLRHDSASELYRLAAEPGAAPVRLGRINRANGLAGATVVQEIGAILVVGSAYDQGLAVCRAPGRGTP